ncbi:hypothetical protein MC7420_991 [Coleofasciculus chthonoplastes PCC 7420]|uniref:Uncharacterized protein n=1 Tax=Coleofasciculus chthonoplastes PCC 7420 TaxID=118168 RepID=B4W0A7_9CYAN|nr:hypothetical protein MC7420_991 [Coleofasciculus chthonoplastes PCC 7420]
MVDFAAILFTFQGSVNLAFHRDYIINCQPEKTRTSRY